MKIGFYLLGQKAYNVLEGFIDEFGIQSVCFVMIGEDKNIADDYSEKLNRLTKLYSIPTYSKNEEVNLESDYSFSIGWRWIIDTNNLIVFHDSLLPKYRGFSPLVNMLINGEKYLGVTALLAVKEYDKGPIIMQDKISINYPMKIQKAIELVSELYLKLVISIAHLIQSNSTIPRCEQNHFEASYSLWRDEFDYSIDWTQNSKSIVKFIDAVGYPYKGASTFVNNKKVRVISAEICEDVMVEARNTHIGKVIFIDSNSPIIVCGEGLLKITHMIHDDSWEKVINLPFRSRFS